MPSKPSAVGLYLRAVSKNLAQGDSTEHTHRPALKALLEALGGAGLTATNEPKRIKCGAPDFRIVRRKVPLGHVETKDVGANLDEMVRGRGPHGEQFLRYRDGLPNWVLTDYLDFRWFVGGRLRLAARLAERDGRRRVRATPDGESEASQLLKAFFEEAAPTVSDAEDLAKRLAGMTRIVRDLILKTLQAEGERGWLHRWLGAFREVLIPDLSEGEFSDMFAQTVAYGLFAARVHAPPDKVFSRELAAFNLPKTNPFLRKLFAEIAGVDMPETIDWAVDDIVQLLGHSDMPRIMEGFARGLGKEDPVVHFYETFLAAYDPKLREVRGVYYTPEPVVRYIVRSLDTLLRTRFARAKGLADADTLILDPAVGTATFLYSVVDIVHEHFKAQAGMWDDYVARHLLTRIFGFELLMAPYSVAHLKLGMQLQQTGYTFGAGQRLGIYLTNTLEQAAKRSERLFATWVSEESESAADIKRDRPILVVLGNPPYSGHSANQSRDESGRLTFIGELIEDYKRGCPELGRPAQAKWLQDDYVKFIRFAQWRIARTGEGLLGFITNHGYLDNPTFRGMRRSLLSEFSDIWVLDLHGNSKKKEKAPGGGPDVNVFDIQQGVAILLCVKERSHEGMGRLHHAHLWGERAAKYAYLSSMDVGKTEWVDLSPSEPAYLFIPVAAELMAEYEKGWPLGRIFGQTADPAPGIVTTQDEFAVAFTREAIARNVESLLESRDEDEARSRFRLCSQDQWNYANAKRELARGEWRGQIAPLLYRPFDVRWTVFNRHVAVHRRERVMRHMLVRDNRALITTRQTKDKWDALVTDHLAGHKSCAAYDINYVSPLYIYADEAPRQGDLLEQEGRRPNLAPAFVHELQSRTGLEWVGDGAGDLERTVGPEDVFDYVYAVLHAPSFRDRYAEFLKKDFPRVPLTRERRRFAELAHRGHDLVGLHLMESPLLDAREGSVGFPERGDNLVEQVRYTAEGGVVRINAVQYFTGVPESVWHTEVGGYQVCERWLKDRRGMRLTYDDLAYYRRVVVALAESARVAAEIDGLIPRWPLE